MTIERLAMRKVRAAMLAALLSLAPGGLSPAGLQAAGPRTDAPADLQRLSVEEIRQLLKALDDEQSAALAEEDYDRVLQVLREINRLSGELEHRSLRAPIPPLPR